MTTLPLQAPLDERSQELTGSVRTFGDTGPMYQVTGIAAPSSAGARVSILVIESGETLDYSLEAVLEDPLKL